MSDDRFLTPTLQSTGKPSTTRLDSGVSPRSSSDALSTLVENDVRPTSSTSKGFPTAAALDALKKILEAGDSLPFVEYVAGVGIEILNITEVGEAALKH
jgi:hypothetical protein